MQLTFSRELTLGWVIRIDHHFVFFISASPLKAAQCAPRCHSIPTSIDSHFIGSQSIRGYLELFYPRWKDQNKVTSGFCSTKYSTIFVYYHGDSEEVEGLLQRKNDREGRPQALRLQSLIGRGSSRAQPSLSLSSQSTVSDGRVRSKT